MSLTSNQSCDQGAPVSLMEPDLAAWAEKVASGSTSDKRAIWYGAAAFWIVVACIIAARVAFLDPRSIHPTTALSTTPSTLAGEASSAAHGAKL
jgi:hypothetical protein